MTTNLLNLDWIDASFVLTMTGMLSGCVTYLLIFFLKSRCTTIKCGCITCERAVLNGSDLHNVSVD